MKILIILIVLFFSNSNLWAQNQVGQDINGEYEKEWLGWDVGINHTGNRIISSSIFQEIGPEIDGIVRIHDFRNGVWELSKEFVNDILGNEFGFSVSMSGDGNTIAIGIPSYDIPFTNMGSVLTYGQVNDNWILKGQRLIGDVSWNNFGFDVDLSFDGNVLCVNALGQNNLIRCYKFVNDEWEIKGSTIFPTDIESTVGCRLSLSDDGNKLVANSICSVSTIDTAKVFAFEYKDSDWAIINYPVISENNLTSYGTMVGLSGNGQFLAIKSDIDLYDEVEFFKIEDSNIVPFGNEIIGEDGFLGIGDRLDFSSNGKILALNGSGLIRLFELNSETWEPSGIDILTEDNGPPSSLAISGNGEYLVYGNIRNNDSYTGAGEIKVFKIGMSTGAKEISVRNDNELIFPNPTHSKITINREFKSVSIYDLNGKQINFEGNRLGEINLYNLPTGIYFIEITSKEGERLNQKLIKQ